MKKLTEMTEEELRAYALQLENEKAVNEKSLADKDKEIGDLKGLNLDLQKLNKNLYLQVEQQGTKPPAEPTPEPKPKEDTNTIESVVKNHYKEFTK